MAARGASLSEFEMDGFLHANGVRVDVEASKQDLLQPRKKHWVFSLQAELTILLLVLVSVGLAIADLAGAIPDSLEEEFFWTDVGILVVFVAEIILKSYLLGARKYFRSKLNTIDALVCVVSLGMAGASQGQASLLVSARLATRLLRILRVMRVPLLGLQRGKAVLKAMRRLVSGNKQRLSGLDVDLDMTYITANIIATSLPAGQGVESMYRNPISKVGEYLDDMHGKHRYLLCNLCAERSYPTHVFHHSVLRFAFEDHHPPAMQMLLHFVSVAEAWLKDPKHVLVVHCKGGKGRTGTMICALLLRFGHAATAQEALTKFSSQRTSNSGGKMQGVSNPSQKRFVSYFQEWLSIRPAPTLQSPPLRLLSVSLQGLTPTFVTSFGSVGVLCGDEVVCETNCPDLPSNVPQTNFKPARKLSRGSLRAKSDSDFNSMADFGDVEMGRSGSFMDLDKIHEDDAESGGDVGPNRERTESGADSRERTESGAESGEQGERKGPRRKASLDFRRSRGNSGSSNSGFPTTMVVPLSHEGEEGVEVAGDVKVELRTWEGKAFAMVLFHSFFTKRGIDAKTPESHGAVLSFPEEGVATFEFALEQVDALASSFKAHQKVLADTGFKLALTFRTGA